jgi:hypothetical protein
MSSFDRERQTKGKDDSIESSSASSKVPAPKVLKCMAKTTWRGSPFPSIRRLFPPKSIHFNYIVEGIKGMLNSWSFNWKA